MNTPALDTAEWIAIDCGTHRLRAWAMEGSAVLAKTAAEVTDAESSEHAVAALISPWSIPNARLIVACGFADRSRQGAAAPHRPVPCAPLQSPLPQSTIGGRPAYTVPALSQTNPPDITQGEETAVAGFLSLNPGWDGVICLPGPHSRWVHLSAEEVVSFQTCMTGELFGLLADHSVLRDAVAGGEMDAGSFEDALNTVYSRPERLASHLFSIRADDLLQGAAPARSRATLAGLLIGAELAATRPYWLGQQIAVIGEDPLADLYARALIQQGVPVTRTDAERMTLAGLTAAYHSREDIPA